MVYAAIIMYPVSSVCSLLTFPTLLVLSLHVRQSGQACTSASQRLQSDGSSRWQRKLLPLLPVFDVAELFVLAVPFILQIMHYDVSRLLFRFTSTYKADNALELFSPSTH